MKIFNIIVSAVMIISIILTCTACGYKIDDANKDNTSMDDNANNINNDNISNEEDSENKKETIKLTPNNYANYLNIKRTVTAQENETINYTGTEWIAVTLTFEVTPKKEDYIFLDSYIPVYITLYDLFEEITSTELKIELDTHGYGINSVTLTPPTPYKDYQRIRSSYLVRKPVGTMEKAETPERIDENKYIVIDNDNFSDYFEIEQIYDLINQYSSLFGSGYKDFTLTQRVSGIYGDYEYKDVHLQIKLQLFVKTTKPGLFSDKTKAENYPIWVYDLKTDTEGNYKETYTYMVGEDGYVIMSKSDIHFNISKINVASGYLIRK